MGDSTSGILSAIVAAVMCTRSRDVSPSCWPCIKLGDTRPCAEYVSLQIGSPKSFSCIFNFAWTSQVMVIFGAWFTIDVFNIICLRNEFRWHLYQRKLQSVLK